MKFKATFIMSVIAVAMSCNLSLADNKPVKLVNRRNTTVWVQLFWKVQARVQTSGLNSPEAWGDFVVGKGNFKLKPGETRLVYPDVYKKSNYSSDGKYRIPKDGITWDEVYIRVDDSNGALTRNATQYKFWTHSRAYFYCANETRPMNIFAGIKNGSRETWYHKTTSKKGQEGHIMRDLGFRLESNFYKVKWSSSKPLLWIIN